MDDVSRTLLLVHAHPDDEVITTGATMAHYAAAGDRVVLVTCTRGELGEVVAEDLAHRHAAAEDTLGEHRVGELEESLRILGTSRHYWLGGPGRWRDSDMMGRPGNDDPRSFWRADLDETADALVGILRAERPDVVLTYDANGGYGHPDHIKAHLTTHAAVARLAPEFEVPKVYEQAWPRSFVQLGIDLAIEAGRPDLFGTTDVDELPFAVPDERITTVIDGSAQLPAKRAALVAHRSQIAPTDPILVMIDLVPDGGFGIETFVCVKGEPVGSPETDLFAGL